MERSNFSCVIKLFFSAVLIGFIGHFNSVSANEKTPVPIDNYNFKMTEENQLQNSGAGPVYKYDDLGDSWYPGEKLIIFFKGQPAAINLTDQNFENEYHVDETSGLGNHITKNISNVFLLTETEDIRVNTLLNEKKKQFKAEDYQIKYQNENSRISDLSASAYYDSRTQRATKPTHRYFGLTYTKGIESYKSDETKRGYITLSTPSAHLNDENGTEIPNGGSGKYTRNLTFIYNDTGDSFASTHNSNLDAKGKTKKYLKSANIEDTLLNSQLTPSIKNDFGSLMLFVIDTSNISQEKTEFAIDSNTKLTVENILDKVQLDLNTGTDWAKDKPYVNKLFKGFKKIKGYQIDGQPKVLRQDGESEEEFIKKLPRNKDFKLIIELTNPTNTRKAIYQENGLLDINQVGPIQTAEYTVNFYIQEGGVTVKYLNESNQEIKASETISGTVGQKYNVADKKITEFKSDIDQKYYELTKDLENTNQSLEGEFKDENIEIIFKYKLQEKKITLKYQDNGQDIGSKEVTGERGSTRNLTDDDAPEYVTQGLRKFKRLTELNNVTLNFENDNEVTVNYEEVKGKVIIKHQLEDGSQFQSDTQIEGSIGASYNLENQKITNQRHNDKLYTFKEVKENKNLSGQISEETQTVIFVYKLAEGKVLVKYIGPDNETLKADTVLSGEIGTDYDASIKDEEKELQFQNKTFIFSNSEGNTKDTFKESETVITHKYSKLMGSIKINYLNQANQAIKEPQTITKQVGESYNLTNEKLDKIIANDKKVYNFSSTEGELVSTVTKEEKTINFKYTEVKSSLKVSYVDINTNQVIKEEVKDNLSVGTIIDLNTISKDRVNYQDLVYQFKNIENNLTSIEITEQAQEIKFIYDLVKAQVEVLNVDEEGNTLETIEVDNQAINTEYNFLTHKKDELTKNNYLYVFEKAQLNNVNVSDLESLKNVKILETGNSIKFYYKKVKANVTVKFIDRNGLSIKPDYVLNKYVGDDYDVSDQVVSRIVLANQRVFDHNETKGNLKGQILKDQTDIVITINYQEVLGHVNIKYVDENGQEIHRGIDSVKDHTYTGSIGSSYDVSKHILNEIEYAGKVYRLTNNPSNIKGKYTLGSQSVVLVYKVVYGDVVINFIDENQINLKPTITISAPIKNKYSTLSHRLNMIGIGNTLYQLVETKGLEEGLVSEANTNVTYIYRLASGLVEIKYVDEKGHEIKPSKKLTGIVGSAYDLKDQLLKKINFNGNTYNYHGINGHLSGIYSTKPSVITLIYTKNQSLPNTGAINFNQLSLILLVLALTLNLKKREHD